MLVAVEEIPAQRFSDRQSYQAMLNVLEDFYEDRLRASETNGAILNILEDFDVDRGYSSDTNRAVINILEDLDESRARTEALNALLDQRVTERTNELTRSEERFRLLVEGVKDYAIVVLDLAGNVTTWNRGAERIKGYQAHEIVGKHFSCFYSAEDQASGKPEQELRTAVAEGQIEDEGWRVRKDGSKFLADVVITALRDEQGQLRGFGKLTRDITERKAAEARARESLRQEMLLKEIHHRVKNNLQVISSLLFLQSTFVQDPATREVLKESQGRVKSIALIHEKLYRSHDLEKLAVGEYVRDLLAEMIRTYGVGQESVSVHSEVEDVYLGIDTAIPCGLIINELMSNALKHAFPEGRGGDVWIEVRRTQDGQYVLSVRDNGIGLPAAYDWQRSKSLGLKLVVDLTKQLDGKLVFGNVEGTSFQITFSEVLYKKRE